ncbi:MAG: hypothetical protein IJX02_06295, partial [Clostridia bacterium]|nr:hypothetical protein [Clostridia bacterium]
MSARITLPAGIERISGSAFSFSAVTEVVLEDTEGWVCYGVNGERLRELSKEEMSDPAAVARLLCDDSQVSQTDTSVAYI